MGSKRPFMNLDESSLIKLRNWFKQIEYNYRVLRQDVEKEMRLRAHTLLMRQALEED